MTGGIDAISVEEFGSLWMLDQIDKKINIAQIIDDIVGSNKVRVLSLGEYFFYAALNRAIDPKSKKSLPTWYKNTAIQHIT